MEKVILHLKQRSLPSPKDIEQLCFESIQILCQQPNVLNIDLPVVVVGDLHGQFYDLLQILEDYGDTNYIFLGNYINKGPYSLQTFLLLLCLKIQRPNKISLLRGSAEIYSVSHSQGFLSEIIKKYGNNQPWRLLTTVFPYLPLAAIVGEQFFTVHGGIGQRLYSIDKIRQINRTKQPTNSGLLCDLLWGCPDHYATSTSNLPKWPKQSFFTYPGLEDFLSSNNLKGLIRGSPCLESGYEQIYSGVCTSLTSCPYLSLEEDNLGATLKITEDGSFSFSTFKRAKDLSIQM